ncbi:MAG: AraC family transcriptional regulator [Actinomycetota bacterium]|nr:AraC family transcriptional regulator [Actinomycetota bacterium]
MTLDDMAMIRSAGLRGLREVVTDLGGDPDALARAARLDPLALDTDELLVDDVAVATVLELAAARLHRPDLGLLVSRHQDISLLGPLAVAIVNSPTVGDTLDATSRYMFVHAPSLRVRLAPDPQGVRGVSALVYEVAPGPLAAPRQVVDICLGFLDGLLRSVVGGPYGLRTVELSHEPVAPIAVYEEFFGVRVLTGRPEALLRIPTSLVSRPLVGADPGIRRMALDFLERQTPPDPDVLAPRVSDALRQTLGTSAPELTDVASLLAVHPRTLQRALAREDTTFARILDSVRCERAHHYLTTTDLPLGQVAALLGLSEQSALSRSARRWWGHTPRDVRRAAALPRRP